MLYQSDRKFRIWAYTVSHSSLLLRSERTFPDQEDFSEKTGYNIDLEFSDVTFINIPTKLSSLVMVLLEPESLPPEIDRSFCQYGRKVFQILDVESTYYIIAGSLLIGTNDWMNEDRIADFGLNLEHDEVLLTV